jgi:hypothetical protein
MNTTEIKNLAKEIRSRLPYGSIQKIYDADPANTPQYIELKERQNLINSIEDTLLNGKDIANFHDLEKDVLSLNLEERQILCSYIRTNI